MMKSVAWIGPKRPKSRAATAAEASARSGLGARPNLLPAAGPRRARRLMQLAARTALALLPWISPPTLAESSTALIERGRYLVKISGCNDCHTPGYLMNGGLIPEKEWLTGDQLGWRGPWGTAYPINLRLYMQNLSEVQWLTAARTNASLPPMFSPALRHMSRQDLRAVYHFIRALGPAGQPAPAFVPPDKEPTGPYVNYPAPQR